MGELCCDVLEGSVLGGGVLTCGSVAGAAGGGVLGSVREGGSVVGDFASVPLGFGLAAGTLTGLECLLRLGSNNKVKSSGSSSADWMDTVGCKGSTLKSRSVAGVLNGTLELPAGKLDRL